jgi:hypothetical protein
LKPAAGFLIGEALIEKAVLFYRNLSGAFSSNLTRRASHRRSGSDLAEGITRQDFGRLAGFAQGLTVSSQDSTEATAEIISVSSRPVLPDDLLLPSRSFMRV